MEAQQPDLTFKVLLLGDAKAGKSKFLIRYTHNSFSEEYLCTIGVDFVQCT